MKKMILMLLVLLSLSAVSLTDLELQENLAIEWCSGSVSSFNESQKQNFGIGIISDDPITCSCWNGDLVSTTDWKHELCAGSEFGLEQESRVVVEKIKPDCVFTVQSIEHRKVNSLEECKLCDDPVGLTSYSDVGCTASGTLVQKRSVIAESWDDTVSECVNASSDEYRYIQDSSVCVGKQSGLQQGDLTIPVLIGFLIALGYIIVNRKELGF